MIINLQDLINVVRHLNEVTLQNVDDWNSFSDLIYDRVYDPSSSNILNLRHN